VGTVASVAHTGLDAQVPSTTGRVDLHHHFYATTPLMKKFAADLPYPGPIFAYSAARSLEAMDQADVSTAMLSCPMTFGDDPAVVRQDTRVFAREMNEYGAKLVGDHRGRFGLFAMLPLPDMDASLREIEYAFDTLKADGVGLATSYGKQWLGDDGFDAVFQELNRLKSCSDQIFPLAHQ
jgi:predicted TIM-barrel fold metal-dependent hydrolase